MNSKDNRQNSPLKRLVPFLQFGSIESPFPVIAPNANYPDQGGAGLIVLFNNLLKLATVLGGIFAFVNILLAGYDFISAGGNEEKITGAWGKIWQSMLGLLVIAGAYILAGIFGWLIYGDVTAITSPVIYGPS